MPSTATLAAAGNNSISTISSYGLAIAFLIQLKYARIYVFTRPKAFGRIVDLLYGPKERPSRVRL